MAAIRMDGEALAAKVKADLSARMEKLAESGVTPGLGTVLVGDDGPSQKYVSMKHADCAEIGMHSVDVRLPATATQADVDAAVDELNAAGDVHAFIVQYPFPGALDYEAAILRVDPAKDADGLHPTNLGHLVMGVDAPLACTPAGVIVGRGLTIGRPLANLLTLKRPEANAAVTVVHTGVADIGEYVRQADIVVAAAGSPELVTADMVKPGAAVVAAGVSFHDGKLRSDVADDVAEVAGWLSPRVGGVGPMTRAMLLANTVAAAERALAAG
jgi:methylenetetrahydrofolate dehydrogenase (NADP+)/methenyltetrahydrofolate cyclohydrolase